MFFVPSTSRWANLPGGHDHDGPDKAEAEHSPAGSQPGPPTSPALPSHDQNSSDSLPAWTWEGPYLHPCSPGSLDPVARLAGACKCLKGRTKWFRRGLADLEGHRRIYRGTWIKELQLHWWQLPISAPSYGRELDRSAALLARDRGCS